MGRELSDSYPDQRFAGDHHAFVTGVIAAALVDSEALAVEVDSGVPVIRVWFGDRRFAVIVAEEQ